MKKPKISENFTLEDIRKIREYNSKIMLKMTVEEQIAYIKKGADRFEKELKEYKEHYKNNIAKESKLAEEKENYSAKNIVKENNKKK